MILVVEKDATYQKLLDDGACEKLSPCIIITVSIMLNILTNFGPLICTLSKSTSYCSTFLLLQFVTNRDLEGPISTWKDHNRNIGILLHIIYLCCGQSRYWLVLPGTDMSPFSQQAKCVLSWCIKRCNFWMIILQYLMASAKIIFFLEKGKHLRPTVPCVQM